MAALDEVGRPEGLAEVLDEGHGRVLNHVLDREGQVVFLVLIHGMPAFGFAVTDADSPEGFVAVAGEFKAHVHESLVESGGMDAEVDGLGHGCRLLAYVLIV